MNTIKKPPSDDLVERLKRTRDRLSFVSTMRGSAAEIDANCVADAAQEIGRLRAALEPFAKAASYFGLNDEYVSPHSPVPVMLGDCRNARATLSRHSPTVGEE